jgi:hypothetical protein
MSAQNLVDLSTSVGTKGKCSFVREFLLFIHYDQGKSPHARAHDHAVIYGTTCTQVQRSLGGGLPPLTETYSVDTFEDIKTSPASAEQFRLTWPSSCVPDTHFVFYSNYYTAFSHHLIEGANNAYLVEIAFQHSHSPEIKLLLDRS